MGPPKKWDPQKNGTPIPILLPNPTPNPESLVSYGFMVWVGPAYRAWGSHHWNPLRSWTMLLKDTWIYDDLWVKHLQAI